MKMTQMEQWNEMCETAQVALREMWAEAGIELGPNYPPEQALGDLIECLAGDEAMAALLAEADDMMAGAIDLALYRMDVRGIVAIRTAMGLRPTR